MPAQVTLILNKLIRRHDSSFILGDIRSNTRAKPVCECILIACICGEYVGRFRRNNFSKDWPHFGEV